jgi:type II secretory pathway pseudopilin PulG
MRHSVKPDVKREMGFTLVEMATVLVIIGLVIGGILVGRDLIKAAEIRSQISQIERYKSAVATFRTKYNGLPGDLKSADAAALGFFARAGGIGDGDGNGIVEGKGGQPNSNIFGGETVFFWTDLSAANLIDSTVRYSTDAVLPDGTKLSCCFPQAKFGNGSYIMAFTSGNLGANNFAAYNPPQRSIVFQIGNPTSITSGSINASPSITVAQAYSIDTKMDDGIPLTGNVVSAYYGRANNAGMTGALDMFGNNSLSDYCITLTTPMTYNMLYPDNVNCQLIVNSGI